ncbi:MAG: phosphatidylinositol-specific phospholipase C1-like protein [Bryobacteraceae bacterium]|nr:phosphatidylinositol-specific phospholipase C1-like protein [Bryobacteraceae bacterium]
MWRIFLLFVSAGLAGAQPVRMNQIQFVGTHNSYHVGLASSEMALLRKQNPAAAESLAYRHPPIEAQLDAGVRQLEIDVYGDAKGGLFADPLYPKLVAKEGLPADPPPFDQAVMRKPGFKVLHAQDVDVRSHCPTFVGCLQIVKRWSRAHPGHLPIYIQIENKGGRSRPEFVEPEKITKATMDALDAEIRSVFADREVVTPDQVRGQFATLEEAVLKRGWPELKQARGKVVFLFDQEKVTPLYVEGHESLEGRMVFTNARPGTPDAAFVKMNNPLSPEIPELVRKGYLVRTMTDGGARAIRAGDTKRRDAALASGAQILSTDYPYEWKAEGSGYSVSLPDGQKARCNPVNAPKGCRITEPW